MEKYTFTNYDPSTKDEKPTVEIDQPKVLIEALQKFATEFDDEKFSICPLAIDPINHDIIFNVIERTKEWSKINYEIKLINKNKK